MVCIDCYNKYYNFNFKIIIHINFVIRSSDLLLSLQLGNKPKPLPKKIEGYKRPKFCRKNVPKNVPVVKSTDIYSIDQLSIPYNEMEQYLHARACYNVKEYQRCYI